MSDPCVSSSPLSAPIYKLHRDEFNSITCLLSLRDFILSTQVCRAWFQAAENAKSREGHINLAYQDGPMLLGTSRLKRHVTQVMQVGRLAPDKQVLYLTQVRELLSHLNYLVTSLPITKTASWANLFSPHLQTLYLTSIVCLLAKSTDIFDVVGTITHLQKLFLYFKEDVQRLAANEIAGLTQLKQLSHLTINGRKLNQEALALVGSLPTLTYLSIHKNVWPPEEIDALVAKANSPPALTELATTQILDDETAKALCQLSNLTCLEPDEMIVTDSRFLLSFPRLSRLMWDGGDVTSACVYSSIDKCTSLTCLELKNVGATEETLTLLLTPLYQLEHLALQGLDHLKSLAFFKQVPHLRYTLKDLGLSRSKLPQEELYHLRFLHSLTELLLKDFTLDEVTLSRFTPTHPYFERKLFPHLRRFCLQQENTLIEPIYSEKKTR